MKRIYMDHAATTPVHPDVIETMYLLYPKLYGNPSSIHFFGREARQYIDKARKTIAEFIGADEREIIFTSGGTESDNLALIGVALANQERGKHIITTNQEHHATLHAAQYLEDKGFQITYLPTYENGQIKLDDLEEALRDDTILVSVMFVNNETGVIQPIQEIGERLKDHQAFFHTDAVQAFGLLPIDVNNMHIDLLSASSHKINGPKGSGLLYVREQVPIQSLHFGGEQERKRRPGTENVIQIVGLKKSAEIAYLNISDRNRSIKHLKEHFLKALCQQNIDFEINGDMNLSVPTIVNISFPGMDVESLLTNLDLEGIAASSGSACTAGSVEPSHVLVAMYGEKDPKITNSIRFSFGLHQTDAELTEAANRIGKIIHRLKRRVSND